MNYEENKKNFDEIYKKSIEPELFKLENERKERFAKFQKECAIGVIVTVVVCVIVSQLLMAAKGNSSNDNPFFTLLTIFTCLTVGIIYSKNFGVFGAQIKKKFLPAILKSFGNFYVVNQDIIPFHEIKKYELFPLAQTKANDDIITGFYKEMEVSIQECELSHRSGKHSKIDFKGLIIKVRFPKNFNGITIVRSDGAGLCPKNLQKVNLEDPEFEKYYDVYSNDQIESRYLLTTAFMERLKNIGRLFSQKLTGQTIESKTYCVFDKGYLILCVQAYENMFEVFKFNHSMLDKELYKSVFLQMTAIFDLLYNLKIDQKIGL